MGAGFVQTNKRRGDTRKRYAAVRNSTRTAKDSQAEPTLAARFVRHARKRKQRTAL
jgi:hypothetical protein